MANLIQSVLCNTQNALSTIPCTMTNILLKINFTTFSSFDSFGG